MDVLYLVIYLFTEFVNYFLGFHVLFHIRIHYRKKNWIVAILLLVAVHTVVAWCFSLYDSRAISIFTMLVIPIFLLKDRAKKTFSLYFFIVTSLSCLSIAVSFLVALLTDSEESQVLANPHLALICQCIPMMLLLGLYFYEKWKGIEQQVCLVFDRKQYILFYTGAICVLVMISSLQYLCGFDLPTRVITVYCFITSVACIVFLFLILWHGVAMRRELQLKEQIRNLEVYTKLEEEHFKQLILQDEKMRRFRHDFNAHMSALRGYCQGDHNQELKEYLETMYSSSALFEVVSYTGDRGVDAVLNELVDKARSENIAIDVKGTLIENSRITSYELCSIFYNLLQNAIEACEKIEDETRRTIWVNMLTYNDKDIIRIKNSTSQRVKLQDGRLLTTKSDKQEHGIGSQNVAAIVKKHNGMISYQCDERVFEVEVVL